MAQWLRNSVLAENLSLDPRASNSSSMGSKTIFFFSASAGMYIWVCTYHVTRPLRVKCLGLFGVGGPVDIWLEYIYIHTYTELKIQLFYKSHLLSKIQGDTFGTRHFFVLEM